MKRLGFLLIYAMPAAYLAGLTVPTWGYWLSPVVAFLCIPISDALLGHDTDEPASAKHSLLADVPLLLWLPTQAFCLVAGLLIAPSLTTGQLIGHAIAMGLMAGGGGINIAHELMHRKGVGYRAVAEVLMGMVSYTWFCVEHVFGHHIWVSTPQDPASAAKGEHVYAFVPASVIGGLRSAWAIETRRCERKRVPWWSPRNKRLRMGLGLAATWGVVAWMGPAELVFFALQAAIAVLLLELINYVEHYGLQRTEVSPGRFERVQPHHSWNATHQVSNWFLFNLQRHADHHAFAARPYDQLRPWPDAPALPWGYPTMVLTALVPPLFWRVMNPRVDQVRAQLTKTAATAS